MQLYYTPGACSLAPHIVFEWLNIPYTRVLANKNVTVRQRHLFTPAKFGDGVHQI